MTLLSKLFRKNKNRIEAQPPKRPPSKDATIRVYDAYGRPLEVLRETWRTKILPDNFRKCWDDSDALASLIVQALDDKFPEEWLEPARRLAEIDLRERHRAGTPLHRALTQIGSAELVAPLASSVHRGCSRHSVSSCSIAHATGYF